MDAVAVHQGHLTIFRAPLEFRVGQRHLAIHFPEEVVLRFVQLVEVEGLDIVPGRHRIRYRVRMVAADLGNPARSLEAVHVAGRFALKQTDFYPAAVDGQVAVVLIDARIDERFQVGGAPENRLDQRELAGQAVVGAGET